MCVSISAENELFIGVIQHPQLGLIRALVQKRTQKAEVGYNLASLALGEIVRQFQGTHLSVVRQRITTSRQNSNP